MNLLLTFTAASSTSAPGDAAPQVAEALRKAGIKGFSDTSERISQSHIDSIDQEDQAWVTEDKSDMPATSILKAPKIERSNRSGSMSRDSSNEITEAKSPSRRKSVTFAEGTKLTDATSSKPKLPNSRRALKTINEIKRQAGLAAFPTRSIKPKPPNRKSNKLLEADRGSDAGHAISGQAIPERVDDARHDSTAIREEENNTAVSKSKTFAETTPGHPSDKLASGEENVSVEDPPDNEAGAQDVDLAPSVIPVDESPEDAALRRQMLRYSMSEVGAVVAEIELDEEDEDLSDASYTDDEDGTISDTSSLEEDEDEHGRTKRRVLDDAYLEEMRALEKKLNATAIQNVGPHANGLTAPVVEKTSGSITRDSSFKDLSKSPTISSISKKVRFAEELDVRDPPLKDQSNSIVKSISKPIKDNIVERVAPMDGHTQPTTAPKKISRFKSARAGNPTISPTKAAFDTPAADTLVERTTPKTSASPRPTSNRYHLPDHTNLTGSESPRLVPTGPSNRTHAPIVIERPYSAITDPSTAVEPDELDPALLHQQVATEYHIMRNRMVQRQGGFLATDGEKEYVPLTEEDGGAPKVSRFKAARLAKLR